MLNEEPLAGANSRSVLSRFRTPIGDTYIRAREAILDRLAGVRPSLVINGGLPEVNVATSDDLAARLRQSLVELKVSAMDESGAQVDYEALRHSRAYAAYREECLAVLRQFKPESLTSLQSRRAFWINLYNALVLDAVITFGVKRSVTEGRLGILAFFRRAAYLVDGQRVSLEDIEHGILRANRGNPYVPGPHFASGDARLAWALPLDPRVHFALNCGGRSCPPIRSYAPEKLDSQLALAARSFLDSTVEVDVGQGEVSLSQILRWYQADFGGRDGMLHFIIGHLPDDGRRDTLLQVGDSLRLTYSSYDWSLNTLAN